MSPTELKKIRLELDVSQERLAHLIGVTSGTINRWEAGKHAPNDRSIHKIKRLQEKGVQHEK